MTSFLEIESPSATTVEFKVSSKEPSASVTLSIIRHFLRTAVIVQLLLFDILKAQQPELIVRNVGDAVFWLEPLFGGIAAKTDWRIVVAVNLVILYLCLRRDYTEESLLVLQGLGIQTSTTSPYYFLSPTTTFIPTTRIQDIVIHEAFKGLEVRFYLAVIVENASEVVVVFPALLPRLDILQQVWRGTRRCLYADSKTG